MSESCGWAESVSAFVNAVEADEYGELELSTGDVLITDWEGDGAFAPYVVLCGERADVPTQERREAVSDAIAEAFGQEAHAIEYDAQNDKLVPAMPRPTDD